MELNRRDFFKVSGATVGAALLWGALALTAPVLAKRTEATTEPLAGARQAG